MTSSTLALETPSSLARSAANSSIALSLLGHEVVADALQRGAQLGLADAEVLGEGVELLVAVRGGRSRLGRGGPGHRRPEPGAQVLQRGAQLRLGDAELGREGARGRRGPPALCSSSSAERTLASAMPSLAASWSAKASRMSPRWPSRVSLRSPLRSSTRLSSADSTLASEMPSSRGERLGERVAEVVELARFVVAQVLAARRGACPRVTPSCLAASASASRGPPRKPGPRCPGPAPKP